MTAINQFYRLRCITNLHVGSGETNYGVIDKLIERDATTGFPCINSTGLKGAIKQKFENVSPTILKEVFGSDLKRNNQTKKEREEEQKSLDKGGAKVEDPTQQGKCFFLSAQLLALPVRSDKIPYFLATSPGLINGFIGLWEDLYGTPFSTEDDLKKAGDNLFKANDHIGADLGQTGKTVTALISDNGLKSALTALLGTDAPIVILSDEKMIELADDLNLPVIARNSLEDGQSKNLWYEQVLPRESVMYFPIIWDEDRSAEFDLTKGTLQVGGNASVGYGFTQITLLS